MRDSWQAGDPYEYYMGRWSKKVANVFVDWLGQGPGLRWLDIGCGSGALSEAIISNQHPNKVVAVDQSEAFVMKTKQRLGAEVECKIGNALSLPLDDDAFDVSISGLVLNFIPEPLKALTEMKRVSIGGGIVGAYVWDYAGDMEFLNYFWDIAVNLNPKATDLHEGRRFSNMNAEKLRALFQQVGLSEISSTALDIKTQFADFNDYWQPFLGGQGPAPTYVASLSEFDRNNLRHELQKAIPKQKNGSLKLSARAWGIKGLV